MARAPEGQKVIWYVAAPNREAARLNPHMERFRRKGIEVLWLYEPVDEFVMDSLAKYKEWEFKSVETAADDALNDFADKEQPRNEAAAPLSDDDSANFDALLEKMKAILGEKVTEVRVSHRLTDSPAILAIGEQDLGLQMRQILEASGQKVPESKPIFEINPGHPLIEKLDAEADEDRFADLSHILFDQAALAAGDSLKDPASYVRRLNKLLVELSA